MSRHRPIAIFYAKQFQVREMGYYTLGMNTLAAMLSPASNTQTLE